MSLTSLRRNFRLLYLVTFFSSATFILPVYILFGVEYLKVSYFQAGALFLVSWITSLILDFLTGSIADKYGRQRVFVVGMLMQIISMLSFLVTREYTLLLLASLITGVGMALVSNTLHALVYEQAKESGEMRYFQHANALTSAYFFSGRVLASIVGGIVYSLQPTLPYLLTICALIIALLISSLMHFSTRVEEHAETHTNLAIMKNALRVFSNTPSLIRFAVIICLVSIWGDYIFTNYQPYFTDQGVSSTTLGYLYAGLSLLSGSGALLMRKLPDRFSPHAINSLTLGGIALTAIAMIVLHVPVALLAPIGLGLVSGFSTANLQLYVNQHAPNHIRSSVLSIATTATGVGSAIGIFFALQLIGKLDTDTIMSICVVGCTLTLCLNIFLKSKTA